MSLTSYRAAPPRAMQFACKGGVVVLAFASFADLAATDSPAA